jgi:protein TonB
MQKKHTLAILLFVALHAACTTAAFAQQKIEERRTVADAEPEMLIDEPKDDKVFIFVEKKPQFPGGEKALLKYIAKNLKWPKTAEDTEGKVFVQFIVEKDGSISNIKVVRGIGSGCDEEAVRIVKNMPKWNAGMENGRYVRVQYNLPIVFKLD